MTPKAALPLDGIRVLDLTRLLPGDYCTLLLSQLGADVVKLEDTGAGDYVRTIGSPVDGIGALHLLVNRGKRSIALDLKDPAGQDAARRLAATADVVVDTFRPGVMERLGLGHDDLLARHPRLVCASISGFGSGGPLAAVPAHDINFLGMTGHLLPPSGGGPPEAPAVPWADLVGGGLLPALTIVALVVRARGTGKGGKADLSIAEGIGSVPHPLLAEALAGRAPADHHSYRWTGGMAWYAVYRAADCDVAVGAMEEPFWARLCEALDMPDLAAAHGDESRQHAVKARLAQALSGLTAEQVERDLAGTCVTVVRRFDELADQPWVRDRGFVRGGHAVPVPAAPFVIDGVRPPEGARAPRQGEHTRAILGELGLSDATIAELLARGVALQAGITTA